MTRLQSWVAQNRLPAAPSRVEAADWRGSRGAPGERESALVRWTGRPAGSILGPSGFRRRVNVQRAMARRSRLGLIVACSVLGTAALLGAGLVLLWAKPHP